MAEPRTCSVGRHGPWTAPGAFRSDRARRTPRLHARASAQLLTSMSLLHFSLARPQRRRWRALTRRHEHGAQPAGLDRRRRGPGQPADATQPARPVVLLLDCCYVGAFERGVIAARVTTRSDGWRSEHVLETFTDCRGGHVAQDPPSSRSASTPASASASAAGAMEPVAARASPPDPPHRPTGPDPARALIFRGRLLQHLPAPNSARAPPPARCPPAAWLTDRSVRAKCTELRACGCREPRQPSPNAGPARCAAKVSTTY